LKPTLLGAVFEAGDVARATELAKDVRREGAAAWQIETTLVDCKAAAQLHEEPNRSRLLDIVAQLEALLAAKAATSGQ
jgi:hypothetical protein